MTDRDVAVSRSAEIAGREDRGRQLAANPLRIRTLHPDRTRAADEKGERDDERDRCAERRTCAK